MVFKYNNSQPSVITRLIYSQSSHAFETENVDKTKLVYSLSFLDLILELDDIGRFTAIWGYFPLQTCRPFNVIDQGGLAGSACWEDIKELTPGISKKLPSPSINDRFIDKNSGWIQAGNSSDSMPMRVSPQIELLVDQCGDLKGVRLHPLIVA